MGLYLEARLLWQLLRSFALMSNIHNLLMDSSRQAVKPTHGKRGLRFPNQCFRSTRRSSPILELSAYLIANGSAAGPGLTHGATRREDQPAWGLTCAAHRHHFTEQWLDSLRCGRWWYVAVLFASRSWAAERGTKYLLRPAL